MQPIAVQFKQIKDLLPRQRGNASLDNLQVLNAILYVAANGCKWRSLPACYGKWGALYRRMACRSQAGMLERVFSALQRVKNTAMHKGHDAGQKVSGIKRHVVVDTRD